MPIASVNGLELNYQLEGDGPDTVVLVNGLADDLWTWDYQVPALLEAGFQLLRFDNRGVGASSKPVGPYTTRMFAEDTKALVDHLGLSGFHMLGISMGGMIAQEYALGWPADLASVVLACTYAAPGPFCGRMYALWAELAVHGGLSSVMRDVLLWSFTPEFFEDRPEEAAEFDTALRMVNQPVPAYLAQIWSIQHHDTTDCIARVQTPTLVLAGDRDILIPVALSKRLQENIPGAEWATTPGGHACMWEYPDEFNGCVIEFLSRHRRKP
jgi:3-oxoadipate enol-lactonase